MDDDALFDLPPEAFTSARDDLAKRLRAEGRREAAAEVAALRRPTAAAWAVNQVARRDADLLEAALEAGEALVREQRRALSGVERADLRKATARRRGAVDAAVGAAEAHLEAAGSQPAAHRDRVRATLEAASVDPDRAEEVRRGRLQRDLPAPTGLGPLGGLALVPEQAESDADPEADAEAAADADAGGDADAADRAGTGAASRRAAAAAAAAADARRRAAEAQAGLERARIRATDADRAVEGARQELQRAEARADEHAAALEDAVRGAAAAAAAADAAEADAEDLAEDARRAAGSSGGS